MQNNVLGVSTNGGVVLYNHCMKWIREPVALIADAINPPEPFTTYVRRYEASKI